MKQKSSLKPVAIQRLSCAALIVLPVLVARVEAAPKSAAPSSVAANPQPARGAIYNLALGRTVELAVSSKATFRVVEGAEVVRASIVDGVLLVEPLRDGQALLVVERAGRTPQNFLFRVRDEKTAQPAPADRVVATSAVETRGNAQTADMSASGTATTGATAPVDVTVSTGTSTATGTVATGTVAGTTVVDTNSLGRNGAVTTSPGGATSGAAGSGTTSLDTSTPTSGVGDTRTISTPPRGALGSSAVTVYPDAPGVQSTAPGGTRVSPSLPSPSRLPSGRAPFPTRSSVPSDVAKQISRAPRNSIPVTQGLARLLQFRRNILSVFFSDINVMDARAVNARTVAITGLAPGTSTLAVFSERYQGDAVGQPNIYQISVNPVPGRAPIVRVTPNVEAVESAIRTALDDSRISVSVIQGPDGALSASLRGSVRDTAEVEAAKATAGLFVPTVVSALYVNARALDRAEMSRPQESDELQSSLRRITDNDTIEVIPAPDGTLILKGAVGSAAEYQALMNLIPLRTRVTPFIVIRGANGERSFPQTSRPTLSPEDADTTEKLQAVTGIRTVYIARTGQNTLAVYGTVRNRAEYDTIKRYALLLPQIKTDNATTERGAAGNGVVTPTELERGRDILAGGLSFNRGVEFFVRILDPNDAILRKVTVQTNLVEINRTALRNLGVEVGSATLLNEQITTTAGVTNIQRTIDPTFLPGQQLFGNGFAGFGGLSNINPLRVRLNALYTKGNARLLSSPNLTAISGAEASITVGGSRPLPSSVASVGGVGTGVIFRRYGIIMTMRPTVTDDDTILLQIRADVTNIDGTTGINLNGAFIPGETVRSVDTTLNVREGDVIVMGGLITNEQSNSTTRVPILSEIPIIGSLFKSKRFQNNETELAIFMSPTIIRTPASPETVNSGSDILGAPPLSGANDQGSGVALIRGTTN